MAQLLTSFDPTNPTSGNFVTTFNTGGGTLHVKNASPVDVGFSLDQSGYVQYVVQAGEPRDIPVPKSRMTVYWSQQNKLNTNAKQIQSVVYVESYECNETIPVSQALARHVNLVNIGFAAFHVSGGTSAFTRIVIANPLNSGFNALFYLANIVCNETTVNNASLSLTRIGGVLVLATPLTPINLDFSAGVSAMTVTFEDSFSATLGSVFKQYQPTIPGQAYSFVQLPTQVKLPPGISLGLNASTTSASSALNLEWTENPI